MIVRTGMRADCSYPLLRRIEPDQPRDQHRDIKNPTSCSNWQTNRANGFTAVISRIPRCQRGDTECIICASR